MAAIIWDTSCETGDPSIDEQHRQMLALVDELEKAELESANRDTIYSVLDRMMDFTFSHFAMEEELMRRVGYPPADQEQMIRQHHEFTSYARLRVIEFRKAGAQSVLPLRTFLAEWLTQHEFGMDKKLSDFIREKNASHSLLRGSEQ